MKPYWALSVLWLLVLASGLLAQGFDDVDFDGDGDVDFQDFLAFADRFGAGQSDPGYEDRFDVDRNGRIGFTDFLIFVGFFGQRRLEVSDVLAEVLRGIKVEMQAGGVDALPVDGFLGQLDAAADQDSLVAIAGLDAPETQLSLDEVRFALGEPTVGDAVASALAQAKLQMAVSGDSLVAVAPLLAALETQADRAALQEIAGEDGQLSLGEAKAALGDPVLSASLAAALDDARLQVNAAGGAPVSVADLLGGLSDADLDSLDALAGEDKQLSLEEITAALGDSLVSDLLKVSLEAAGDTVVVADLLEGLSDADQAMLLALAGGDGQLSLAEVTAVVGKPLLSDALKALLVAARQQVTADGVPVGVTDMLGGISEADRAVLATLAGEDGQLSLDEAKVALGEPVVSEAGTAALEEARLRVKAAGGAPVSVADLVAELSPEDSAKLQALAGEDGELSLGEVKAGLGDPVSEAVSGVLDLAKAQMMLDGLASVPIDGLLVGLSNEADRNVLSTLAGKDGRLSLEEAKKALGDPEVSESLAGALEDAQLRVKAAGGAVPVADLWGGLSDAGLDSLDAFAGEDGKLSLAELTAALGDSLVSDSLKTALEAARLQAAAVGDTVVAAADLLEGLSDADQAILLALAGEDGELSLAEVTAAAGKPLLSDALKALLATARQQVTADGVPAGVTDLLGGTTKADRENLKRFAGEDGELSLGEVKAGSGGSPA